MELKPCPFCNSDDDALDIFPEGTVPGLRFVVVCSTCRMRGPGATTAEAAMRSWNARHMPPEVAALVEACRVFVTSYEQHYRKEYSKPWEVDCLNCMIAALAPFQEANDGIATE